jgi:hypothetical protein
MRKRAKMLLTVPEPEAPIPVVDEAVVDTSMTVTPTRRQGKSAKAACFYLRREQRRGWTLTDDDEQGLIDLVREAWHEAVDEPEVPQEAGA